MKLGGKLAFVLKMCLVASLVAVASLSSPNAQAKPALLWKAVGNWQIRVDQTLGFGCFMIAGYRGSDVLRIGFDVKDKAGYMLFGNSAWRSLLVGRQYPIGLKFDNYPIWNTTARAVRLGKGTAVFLDIPFHNPTVLRELEDSQAVKILYHGRIATGMQLEGSQFAVQEMFNCQKSMIAATHSEHPSDPFASKSSTDPFSK